ncbi:MAG: hypothetical protein HFJ20_02235 [Clostridia bacterium]|nr:hypothetical protein [Clostridia bacterium]
MVVLLQRNIGLEQNKKVFCLPRNIDESKGVGTNQLIKNGAVLVTSPNEILEELGINDKNYEDGSSKRYKYKNKSKSKNKEKSINSFEENKHKLESVDNEYIDIYNLIPYYPVSIEYLARKSDLRISEINQKLTMLELQALIKSLPGNNYVRI